MRSWVAAKTRTDAGFDRSCGSFNHFSMKSVADAAKCGPKPREEPTFRHIVQYEAYGRKERLLFAITMPKWLTQHNKGATEREREIGREGVAIYLFAVPSILSSLTCVE